MEQADLIQKDFIEALSKYPKLCKPYREKENWLIDGKIEVIDEEGTCWDSYDVRILLPMNYPNDPPELFETGIKIKRHLDWHVTGDGWCCVAPKARVYQALSTGITLKGWLDSFVVPFFANHIYKLKTGEYANKEYSHGSKGIYEFYEELFQLGSIEKVIERLKLIIGIKEQSKNRECFCGSGKKYKRCYLINPSTHYLNIPLRRLKQDLKYMRETRID
jgi:SEC-C motif